MIRACFEAVKKEVQNFLDLKDADGIREVSVVVSNILDQDGKPEFGEEDGTGSDHHLIITLVNIEEEKTLKSPVRQKEIAGDFLARQHPEVHINLYALFTAFSSQYETALGIVSDVIGFFQNKPMFNHENTPELHKGIEKIIAELYSLTFEQQNYLWSLMGAKYMPSVMYKLRMLSIDEQQVKDKAKPIMEIRLNEGEDQI